jgi:hypothetical protein
VATAPVNLPARLHLLIAGDDDGETVECSGVDVSGSRLVDVVRVDSVEPPGLGPLVDSTATVPVPLDDGLDPAVKSTLTTCNNQ